MRLFGAIEPKRIDPFIQANFTVIEHSQLTMVKFGLKLMENRAADYPPDVYMDYEKLKNFIKELASKKLAR